MDDLMAEWAPTWAERLDPTMLDHHNTRERLALRDWLVNYAGQTTIPLEFAVTGSRTWWDWRLMWAALSCVPASSVMRNGKATGADCLAYSFWRTGGGTVDPFEANWKELGKRAGHERNKAMINATVPLVIGFLCHADASRGTRDALDIAHEMGTPTFVFHQKGL
jgi:hypothetical protein